MERNHEEKAATQKFACSGARPLGWPGTQRSQEAPTGRTGARAGSSKAARRPSRCGAMPFGRVPDAARSLNWVMAVIRARYGFVAIGLGDGGIRYAAPALR